MFISYRKALYSPLDLSTLLRDSIVMSRSPCPSPSPPPDLYWKLLLLYPRASELSSNAQQELSWIFWKLRSSHAASESSGSSPASILGDLDFPVFPLSMTSSPLPSLSVPGEVESADFGECVGGRGRQLHMVVQGITPEVHRLVWECRRRAVLGACSLAIFVPAPSCDDVHPEASEISFMITAGHLTNSGQNCLLSGQYTK